MDIVAKQIVQACIDVHKSLGPGLLENIYEEALIYELELSGLMVERQKPIPVSYKGKYLGIGYKADLVVESSIILELKSVESFAPVHLAQILTYMKLSNFHLGFLLNFNVPLMKDGIKRVAL